MARIRTIKPGFFRSLSVTELPKPTRLTWIGLWTYVDDAGRGVDDARLIKAELWPLDDDYPAKKVEKDLVLLEANGSIRRYVVDGRRYLAVCKWEHQRIDKPTTSILPPPPENEGVPLPPNSGNPPGKGREASVQEEEQGLGRDGEVEVEDLSSSSSKLSLVGEANPEEEDNDRGSWDGLLVARLVARRRLGKLSNPPPEGIRRNRWLSTTVDNLLAADAETIRARLAEGLGVEAVVDLFEPPDQPAAAPPSPYPLAGEQSEPAHDIEFDDEGHAFAVPRSVGA